LTELIDLRSDTVTRPTPEMRRAMAEAEVGDDVYGEDPSVNALQDEVATLLGFEAALWFPTGTMANASAIRILSEPGQEVLVEERSHIVRFELAGMAVLSGVLSRTLRTSDGHLTAEHVRSTLTPSAYYKSDLSVVALEQTHNLAGGTVQPLDELRRTITTSQEAGLRVHLDGARLWHAAVSLAVEPRALAQGADTVMVSLSKGLCAPAGSLLAASRERIERARRVRKQLGGGMRQVGVLAAAGRIALGLVERLAEDHEKASLLRQSLVSCAGVDVAPSSTNIVVVRLRQRSAHEVARVAAERGVLAGALDHATLRLVTHRDVSLADCRRAAEVLCDLLSAQPA
jgi:threonine aldolase